MNRYRFSMAVLVLMFALAAVVLAEEAEQPEVVTTDLGGGLHLIAGLGGNVLAHISEHDVLMVDSGYPGYTELLQDALAEKTALPVRLLVNTHWHFDHTGGNQILAGAGAVVIAHRTVRQHQSTRQHFEILDRDVEPVPPLGRPAVTCTEALTLHHGDETIDLMHVASAHTDGDLVVRFRQANVVHTGDVVFYCGYPFIDIGHGGTIDGVIAAVEKVLTLCDSSTRVIPGHGPMTDVEGLETYRDMLRGFREAVAKEKAAGKDLEAIRTGTATAELDERWGAFFFPPAQFVEMVYRSLPE
jgi:glyoxylase-like metal-dependent hydrolase (beta-lactamase superfamily II)